MKTQEEPKQDFDRSKYVSGIDPIVEETLEEVAKEFYPPTTTDLICSPKLVRDAFIAGAKSDAARDYWFKVFKEQFIVSSSGK